MNNQQFGFKDGDLEAIIKVLQNYPIDEAIIFGSRAKGNYKNVSDIDLAIKSNELTYGMLSQINYQFNEEINLPYMFDVINYLTLDSQELIAHIDRVGKTIYVKNNK